MEQSYELFHLKSDPFEKDDCSMSHPDKREAMKVLLDEARKVKGLRFLNQKT